MVVHYRIMVAMDNEKWRRVLADVGDGAGAARLVRVVPNGASNAAVSPKSDQMFCSGGRYSSSVFPLPAPAEQT